MSRTLPVFLEKPKKIVEKPKKTVEKPKKIVEIVFESESEDFDDEEVREMNRKIEDDKKKKEMSNRAMSLLEKLLDENRQNIKEERVKINQKKDEEERVRKIEEEKIRIANEKRCERRKEVVAMYGEAHEMSSQCEYVCRCLTPIEEISISPPRLMWSSDLKFEEKVELPTIKECREYDEREHYILSQETQSFSDDLSDNLIVEEDLKDLIDEME